MKTTPLLTQIRPTYFSVDCGMAYLIRLSDGRFVLIDSAYGEYDEVDRLYELISARNETGKIPTVAAWFFTHPHGDHTGGFIKMSHTHKDKIVVEKVIYNFPEDMCEKTHDHKSFLEAIKCFGAETVTPHKGDVLHFGGAEFKILFAAEDCQIRPLNVNETSLSMIMTLGNYSVMWMGDLQHIGSKIVTDTYKPEELKCDILQVGHHGYWGGSFELFAAVDPDIIIWPMPEFRYLDMLAEPYNRFFTSPENHARHIFVSGIEENTFDLTAPIEITEPYVPKKTAADFTQKSIRQLGWACITGGNMGYDPLDLSFEENSCTLKTRTRRTLLQMIQRGQVAVSNSYRFTLTMTPESECDVLGLIYDCPTPTTPDSYTPYSLPHKAGEEMTVVLVVDRKAGEARITVNGKTETLALRTSDPCDLILIVKEGRLKISEAVFENM
ncbi:MAG: MBL fold metallo-hydrolase [Clostridia bacterium]|nr:MBL fold metallo-hydrolase [Clostridia bacterium]